mmetsp:Transcript_69018/g.108096  ORF Transcript_69018/g.108096 Transcript_69018/m.108096 type:complete len:84 (+) Transcript_69018:615-866(+)
MNKPGSAPTGSTGNVGYLLSIRRMRKPQRHKMNKLIKMMKTIITVQNEPVSMEYSALNEIDVTVSPVTLVVSASAYAMESIGT